MATKLEQRISALKTLGVSKNASERDIKKAYKKLCLQYHPDRTGGDKEKENIFKQMKDAYDFLLGNIDCLSDHCDNKPKKETFEQKAVRLYPMWFKGKCVSLLHLAVWQKIDGLNLQSVTSEKCLTIIFNLMEITETKVVREKFCNYIATFLDKQAARVVFYDQGDVKKEVSYNTLEQKIVLYAAMFFSDFCNSFSVTGCNYAGKRYYMPVAAPAFSYMKSSFKAVDGQKVKRNRFEMAYQKFMP